MATKKSTAVLEAAEAHFAHVAADDLRTSIDLVLIGTQQLIVHAWSKKARDEMRDKHMKKARAPREAKDPVAEFEAAKYRLSDSTEGVPAHGLKGAFVEGARFVGGSKELNMTTLKSALFVPPDCLTTNNLRLYSQNPPVMREDLVRVGSGMNIQPDLRYRPGYWPWFLRISVQFPTSMFSPQQIIDVIRAAGAFNGFCEWRPNSPKSKTGSFGTFRIASPDEEKVFEKTFRVAVHG